MHYFTSLYMTVLCIFLSGCWPTKQMERVPTKAIYLDEVLKEGQTGPEKLRELIKEGNVIVDFYAQWCPPCHMMHPIMDELADSYWPHVKVIKVDIDLFGDIAHGFTLGEDTLKVISIPYFYFFKDGKLVQDQRGGKAKPSFKELIDSTFPSIQIENIDAS